MDDIDFRKLWTRSLDGLPLAASEEESLHDALLIGSQFRAECLQDAQIHGMLTTLCRCQTGEAEFVDGVMSELRGEASQSDEVAFEDEPSISAEDAHDEATRFDDADETATVDVVSPKLTVIDQKSADSYRPSRPARRNSRSRDIRAMAFTVAVLLVAVAGFFQVNSGDNSTDDDSTGGPIADAQGGAAPQSSAEGEANPPTEPVAQLVEMRNCVWPGNRRPEIDLKAGPLRLIEGMVKLRFTSGAEVTLTGPMRFDLRSANSGFLHTGDLFAHVPKPAVGFAVQTPTAKVVDLGTEFDIRVDESGATDVSVREGSVEVEQLRKDGSTGTLSRLTKGQSRRFGDSQSQTPRANPVADAQPARPAAQPRPPQTRPVQPQPPAAGNGNRVFRGTIIINGVRRTYNSREEFDRLREELEELRKNQGGIGRRRPAPPIPFQQLIPNRRGADLDKPQDLEGDVETIKGAFGQKDSELADATKSESKPAAEPAQPASHPEAKPDATKQPKAGDTFKAWGIEWHHDIDTAFAAAKEGSKVKSKSPRLVMHHQSLGDLEGFT